MPRRARRAHAPGDRRRRSSRASPTRSWRAGPGMPLGTMKSLIRRGLIRTEGMPVAMSRTFAGHERDDADLAAEYVLGVLDGAERRVVERRAAARSRLRAPRSTAWAERLGPLAAAVPRRAAGGVWGSASATDLDRMTRRLPQPGGVAARRPRGRRVSAIWQWLGLAGMGLAAASIAALILVGTGRNGCDGRNAARDDDRDARARRAVSRSLTVVIDRSNNTGDADPDRFACGDGRVPELWLVPPGGASPRSLGLSSRPTIRCGWSSRTAASTCPTPRSPSRWSRRAGRPTGLPTGPVVASGALHSV